MLNPDLVMLLLMCLVGLASASLLIWGFQAEDTMSIQHAKLTQPNFNPKQDLIREQAKRRAEYLSNKSNGAK